MPVPAGSGVPAEDLSAGSGEDRGLESEVEARSGSGTLLPAFPRHVPGGAASVSASDGGFGTGPPCSLASESDGVSGSGCSCYVKFKGLNPRFHVFFVFSRFLNSFLSFEDKNPPSAISCSPFYVKLFLLYFSIKKSDTVIGGGLIIIRSPTRMGPQLVGVGLLCV